MSKMINWVKAQVADKRAVVSESDTPGRKVIKFMKDGMIAPTGDIYDLGGTVSFTEFDLGDDIVKEAPKPTPKPTSPEPITDPEPKPEPEVKAEEAKPAPAKKAPAKKRAPAKKKPAAAKE